MATLDSDDRIYLEALFVPIRETLKRHDKTLYGNGQQGLVERMTQRDGTLGLHAQRLNELEGLKHSHGTKERLSLGGVTAFVAAVVAGVIAAVANK